MKIILSAMVMLTLACSDANTNEAPGANRNADTTSATKISYPFKASVSSSFEIGNPQSTAVVLSMMKDFDDNKFDNMRQHFADSVFFFFEGGETLKMSGDSTVSRLKSFRKTATEMSQNVHAFLPLRSTDKDQNYVLVYTTEYSTIGGKKDSVLLHELWELDKSNKVMSLRQFRFNLH